MIDLDPTPDQAMFADAVEQVLRRTHPLESLVNDGDTSPPPDRWREWAELGWFRLGVEERHGGLGTTIVEEILAHRLFGRHLLTPALLATTISAAIAADAGEAELAEVLMAGRQRAAFAMPLDSQHFTGRRDVEVLAADAAAAQVLLVLLNDEALLLRGGEIAAKEDVKSIDDSLVLCRIRSRDARIAVRRGAGPALHHATVLIAAHLAAAAEESCRLAVEYAKLRQQFGKPIGTFQAVAHHCADMASRARAAWAQARFAALAVHHARGDAAFQADAALIVSNEAANKNAAIAIRVHGGLGFTTGCAVHRYLKRAILLREVVGGVQSAARRLIFEPPAF